ncbi:sulfotransferase domain-containing protein [Thiocapsa rosea]|uniref:Sulfotransferase domain-containing protein n=1 Tax=Thiocapsa rosea TaxID=69360 RepID=A0A495V4X9_9GAMM|nr:sulfotransferase domain-containing protein [Thiocapsa rosea]RKT44462.1 sulfotransferase domain-containing protein [Thiocapsa rosea]
MTQQPMPQDTDGASQCSVQQRSRLPNFLVIGAQKSATTWLWSLLQQHPDIFMPDRKELNYFCYYPLHRWEGWKGPLRSMSLGQYSDVYFSAVAGEKAIGEATPAYLWVADSHPEWLWVRQQGHRWDTPAVVRDLLGPDVKLLAVLRNPVDRAVSAFHHHQLHGTVAKEARIMDVAGEHGIVHIGFYYEHLRAWMKNFDRANFLIQVMEEDLADPAGAMRAAYQFLGVDATFSPIGADTPIHIGTPGGVVTREDRQALWEIFRGDIERLEILLDRDLSIWKPRE